MTKFGTWNIRGLNDPLKQKEVCSFVKLNNLSFFGVVETKVRSANLSSCTSRCFPGHWQSFHNIGSLSTARIILGWDPHLLSVAVVFCSPQMVVVSVEMLVEHKCFFASVVYGLNQASERVCLWRDMRSLVPLIGNSAWVQMGDFNVVRRPDERIEGFDASAADDFNSCITDINMQEMMTKGFWYTWTNKRGGLGNNKSRLDRVLVNGVWLDLFKDSEVVGHAPGIYDHCALVLTVLPPKFRACPFKFFNFWMADARFKELLGDSWSQMVVGNPFDRLSLKLRRLKLVLKGFHKQNFSHVSGRMTRARANLAKIQELCFRFPQDQYLSDLEKDLVQQFFTLGYAEEAFKKQRSRVTWLALGDRNTKFFHQKMNAHRARNSIFSLVNAHGVRLEEQDAIEAEIIGYYQGLIGTSFDHKWNASEVLSAAVTTKVPSNLRDGLISPVTDAEIWKALRSINRDKSPGPDGYNSAFFLDNWEVVRPDFVAGVLFFF